jgi:DNA repair exonuclease SbcCD ATPase subunit
LQGIVTGGGADEAAVSAVLAGLGEKIAEMERGWRTHAPKNPGPIKVKQDEIARLDERLSDVRPQVGRAEGARENLVGLEAQIDDIAEELASRQALKASCDQRSALEEELKTWEEKEKKLETKIEKIERLMQQLDSHELAQPAEERDKARFPVAPLLGFSVGIVLILVGLVIGILRSPIVGLLLGLPGGLIGVGCFVWLLITLVRSRSVDPQTAIRARLDALLEERTLEDWVEERKGTSRQRRDAEEALEEPEMQKSAEVTPLEYEELKQEIERLEEELEKKKQEQTRQETRRDDATYTMEDIHQLEEQKAAAERELDRLKERLIVYKLTHEVMEEAKEQTMSSARGELEPRIANHLSYITQGRYNDVKADDELNLRVFSSEKEGWIAADSTELSRGTLDQLYLAARLALLELLYRDAQPPLLLDDPFVKFDPDRRKQAVELCKEIAKTHQVLLFTCHAHYDPAADWIVELTVPS